MPLPAILLAGAALAGSAGVVNAAKGTKKMVESNEDKKAVNAQHSANLVNYEGRFNLATQEMDRLGEKEISILSDFLLFSDVIEKIENRPEFGEIVREGFELPDLSLNDVKDVATGAAVVAGGVGGVAAGTFGGFAAAGATTSAVMALGTASTGTAIASLSGAAATNATLAALGGGAIAAGGGGMALGSVVLGAATAGVGLMVGGIIFNITGNTIKTKVDEAKEAVEKETYEVNKVCIYLEELANAATNYLEALKNVKSVYDNCFLKLRHIVEEDERTDYRLFTDNDKLAYSNTVMLVGILYDMLKVNIVSKVDEEHKEVNAVMLNEAMGNAYDFIKDDDSLELGSEEVFKHDVTNRVIDFSPYDVEAEKDEEKGIGSNVLNGVAKAATVVSDGWNTVSPHLKKGAKIATNAALSGAAIGATAAMTGIEKGVNAIAKKIKESKED